MVGGDKHVGGNRGVGEYHKHQNPEMKQGGMNAGENIEEEQWQLKNESAI